MCLAAAEIITGIFVSLTPWADSFPLLIGIVTIFGLSLGLFDTADNSLMVYMFGPKKSRPFTQSVHAFVGVGFVLGSVLVQPFLPDSNAGDSPVFPGEGENEAAQVEYTYKHQLAFYHHWGLALLTAVGMIILGFS